MGLFNVNGKVRVRLTPRGRTLHRKNYDDLVAIAAGRLNLDGFVRLSDFLHYRAPEEDSEGWSTWQLWNLFEEFGPHVYHGCEMPFETEIQLL